MFQKLSVRRLFHLSQVASVGSVTNMYALINAQLYWLLTGGPGVLSAN